MTTQVQATDEMLSTLKIAWDANTPAITTTVPPLVTEFEEKDARAPHPSTGSEPWARVLLREQTGRQTSMGGVGNRRFKHAGMVWVSVFVPWKDGADVTKAESLANVVKVAYEGQSSATVNFSRVASTAKGRDGTFYRWDVTVNYDWTEIK